MKKLNGFFFSFFFKEKARKRAPTLTEADFIGFLKQPVTGTMALPNSSRGPGIFYSTPPPSFPSPCLSPLYPIPSLLSSSLPFSLLSLSNTHTPFPHSPFLQKPP